MGLKIETWSIAYREKKGEFFDKQSPFKVINNGHNGWYADPFLVDYKDDTYLFAEFFSYKLNRGIIVCSKFNKERKCFSKFENVLVENFHLSYPVIFEFKDKMYMMPETSKSNRLFLYECQQFPYKWKRTTVMSNVKLVDTTPYVFNDSLFALSLKLSEDDLSRGELVLLKFNGKEFNIVGNVKIDCDMSLSRPGGNFIYLGDELLRVSQKCDKEYGEAINFLGINKNFVDIFEEKLKFRISSHDIVIEDKKTSYSGIHTYNSSSLFEVVDLKSYNNSFTRLFYRIKKLLGKR